MKTKVITPECRLSYPNLFEPRKNDLSGKDEYSAVLLFKMGEDLSALKRAMAAACEKKWGPDKSKWPTAKFKNPTLRDQGERRGDDGAMPAGYEEGAIFVNVKSKDAPGVVDQRVQKILDPAEIYAGCWVRASLNAYAYDVKGNCGVSFGLLNVQKVRDGEAIGTRSAPDQDFQPVSLPDDGTEVESPEDLF